MHKRLLTLLFLLSLTAWAFAVEPLVLTKATTLSDITPWQGADVRFEMSQEMDWDTYVTIYEMGALTLDAPATPKWQIGRFTLPVSFYNYETIYEYDENTDFKATDVYAIGSFLNERTSVEAEAVEIKLDDAGDYGAWTVFSVPFDVNFDDIQGGKGDWVIRRYSGENRAAVMSGRTWVDVGPGEQLHANEGYIFQRDYMSLQENYNYDEEEGEDDSRIILPAAPTENKQHIFASGDVVVPLRKYPAEMSHNADWNLVGNPYPCYYDLRALKEAVTIYIWDGDEMCYRTFLSSEDNGFLLAPCQAFFVQATDVSQLTFSASGRRISGNFKLPDIWSDIDDPDWAASLPQEVSSPERRKASSTTFNPTNPLDPGANYFNPVTGEAYFDLFDNLLTASRDLLGSTFEGVKSVTVAAPLGEYFTFMLFTQCQRVDLERSGGFATVPASAFTYMMNLREVVLPACVTAINKEAFKMCIALEQVDCHALTPPAITSEVFGDCPENLVIRVPREAVAAYKAADVWKDLNIQALEGGGEELQSVTLVVKTPDGLDLTGRCNILWRDTEGNLLGTGATLTAQPVGRTVVYSIGLPSDIANLYMPVPEGSYTVQSSVNVITIQLTAPGVVTTLASLRSLSKNAQESPFTSTQRYGELSPPVTM